MIKRVPRRGGWSVAVLAGIVNAGCFTQRVPPQPVPEQLGRIPLGAAWEARSGSGFSGTMVVSDSVLYAGGLDRKVYAISTATGHKLWSKRLPGAVVGGVAHSGDTLFVGTDRPTGRVRALDGITGEEIWEARTARIAVPLLVMDGTIVAHGIDGSLYALRSRDGTNMWQRESGISLVAPVPGGDGSIIATTLDTIYRLALDDGRLLQHVPSPGAVTSPWVLEGDYLLGGTASGMVVKLDRRDLHVMWQLQLPSEVLVSPVSLGDTVFAITRPGDLFRIDPGEPRTAELVSRLDRPVTAPLTVYGHWIMVGGADGVLRAIDPDGSQAWELALWRPIAVPPVALPDGFVAFGGIGDMHRLVVR